MKRRVNQRTEDRGGGGVRRWEDTGRKKKDRGVKGEKEKEERNQESVWSEPPSAPPVASEVNWKNSNLLVVFDLTGPNTAAAAHHQQQCQIRQQGGLTISWDNTITPTRERRRLTFDQNLLQRLRNRINERIGFLWLFHNRLLVRQQTEHDFIIFTPINDTKSKRKQEAGDFVQCKQSHRELTPVCRFLKVFPLFCPPFCWNTTAVLKFLDSLKYA